MQEIWAIHLGGEGGRDGKKARSHLRKTVFAEALPALVVDQRDVMREEEQMLWKCIQRMGRQWGSAVSVHQLPSSACLQQPTSACHCRLRSWVSASHYHLRWGQHDASPTSDVWGNYPVTPPFSDPSDPRFKLYIAQFTRRESFTNWI